VVDLRMQDDRRFRSSADGLRRGQSKITPVVSTP